MMFVLSQKSKRTAAALLLCGAAAGFLNGLLGAGGGIVLIYALAALKQDDSPDAVRDTFAAAVACILPMTALSALLYASDGRIRWEEVPMLVLPAAAGGILGAFLLDRLPTKLLKKIFAVLVLIAGIRMLT